MKCIGSVKSKTKEVLAGLPTLCGGFRTRTLGVHGNGSTVLGASSVILGIDNGMNELPASEKGGVWLEICSPFWSSLFDWHQEVISFILFHDITYRIEAPQYYLYMPFHMTALPLSCILANLVSNLHAVWSKHELHFRCLDFPNLAIFRSFINIPRSSVL